MAQAISAQIRCVPYLSSRTTGRHQGAVSFSRLYFQLSFTLLPQRMGAGATVAAGSLIELKCSEGVSVWIAAVGETSGAVNPGGAPESPIGSTPFLPQDLNKPPANPQEGCY